MADHEKEDCLTPMSVVIQGLATTSDKIRALADAGYARADIARFLQIRYQHVRTVLVARENESAPRGKKTRPPRQRKRLSVTLLKSASFTKKAEWIVEGGALKLSAPLDNTPGVYAFVAGDDVLYVGKAARSLKQRLYQYGKPSSSQLTNIRLNPLIREQTETGIAVEVYVAEPGSAEWNGLPVDLVDGLEGGLIKQFNLPWNKVGRDQI